MLSLTFDEAHMDAAQEACSRPEHPAVFINEQPINTTGRLIGALSISTERPDRKHKAC